MESSSSLDSADDWVPGSIQEGTPPDLSLIVGGRKFQTHKHILQNGCEYFRGMFSSEMVENFKDEIETNLVSAFPFKIIIQGFYSGSMTLTDENIYQVVEAAHILQLEPNLFAQCENYLLKMLNPVTCFQVMYFCDSINFQPMYTQARRYCLGNFTILKNSVGITDLSLAELYDYLSDELLVVREERDVVQALRNWCKENELTVVERDSKLNSNTLRDLVTSCVHLKREEGTVDKIIQILSKEEDQSVNIADLLCERPRQEDMFLFWSRLKSTTASIDAGLVDVVKLCPATGQGVKIDTMTDVVEKPGYDLGSAFCVYGSCVYLCGGGPHFGKVDWIRQIFCFDTSKSCKRWEVVGQLYETRRHHAMQVHEGKMYIFGGFGKFRTRNTKLDCFDMSTGSWESLPSMPTHVSSPKSAMWRDYIFYVDNMNTIFCYDVRSKIWTQSDEASLGMSPLEPLALFSLPHFCPVSENDSESTKGSLLALWSDERHVRVMSVEPVWDNEGKIQSFQRRSLSGFQENRHFQTAALVDKKVVMLFEDAPEDDIADNENTVPDTPNPPTTVSHVKVYDLLKKNAYNIGSSTNVVKALVALTVPRLPEVFKTGCFDPNRF